uniref:Putative secreted protein n=1 Tax=Panstrongylus lignarius TaxID=156445 RepID=A0A224Y0C6_9HEMI
MPRGYRTHVKSLLPIVLFLVYLASNAQFSCRLHFPDRYADYLSWTFLLCNIRDSQPRLLLIVVFRRNRFLFYPHMVSYWFYLGTSGAIQGHEVNMVDTNPHRWMFNNFNRIGSKRQCEIAHIGLWCIQPVVQSTEYLRQLL